MVFHHLTFDGSSFNDLILMRPLLLSSTDRRISSYPHQPVNSYTHNRRGTETRLQVHFHFAHFLEIERISMETIASPVAGQHAHTITASWQWKSKFQHLCDCGDLCNVTFIICHVHRDYLRQQMCV